MPKLSKLNLKSFKPIHVVLVILLLIIVLGAVAYFNSQRQLKSLKNNPSAASDSQVNDLVAEVGKLIDLPQGETPTVATVTDPAKLRGQQFFEKSQTGDKVLIYNNAKKAILYRPSVKKVLEIAPINIGSDQGKAADQSKEIKFVILNGTTTTGLAGRYQEEVKGKIKGAKIASIGNASDRNVGKTFIATSKGDNSQQADIAKSLGIEVGTLPSDQLDKDADFVIVVGSDKAKD